MWIIITKKLNTPVSPPKLSIFWSTPYVDAAKAAKQAETWKRYNTNAPRYHGGKRSRKQLSPDELELELEADRAWAEFAAEEDYFWSQDLNPSAPFPGKEHNETLARGIVYRGARIRVYKDEYNVLTLDRMKLYIFGVLGGDHSHELMTDPTAVADDILIKGVLDGETRPIYEAALVDGCNDAQAVAVALGQDITIPDAEFVPLGWYKCLPHYAEIYCHDWEMVETYPGSPDVESDHIADEGDMVEEYGDPNQFAGDVYLPNKESNDAG
jgi:hypothetical protein